MNHITEKRRKIREEKIKKIEDQVDELLSLLNNDSK